jgi:hypothetical protein
MSSTSSPEFSEDVEIVGFVTRHAREHQVQRKEISRSSRAVVRTVCRRPHSGQDGSAIRFARRSNGIASQYRPAREPAASRCCARIQVVLCSRCSHRANWQRAIDDTAPDQFAKLHRSALCVASTNPKGNTIRRLGSSRTPALRAGCHLDFIPGNCRGGSL